MFFFHAKLLLMTYYYSRTWHASRSSTNLSSPYLARPQCALQGSCRPPPGPWVKALGGEAQRQPSAASCSSARSQRDWGTAEKASSDTLLHRTVCALLPPPESSELSKYGYSFFLLLLFSKHQEHLGEENEHQTWFANDFSQMIAGGRASTVLGVMSPV